MSCSKSTTTEALSKMILAVNCTEWRVKAKARRSVCENGVKEIAGASAIGRVGRCRQV